VGQRYHVLGGGTGLPPSRGRGNLGSMSWPIEKYFATSHPHYFSKLILIQKYEILPCKSMHIKKALK